MTGTCHLSTHLDDPVYALPITRALSQQVNAVPGPDHRRVTRQHLREAGPHQHRDHQLGHRKRLLIGAWRGT